MPPGPDRPLPATPSAAGKRAARHRDMALLLALATLWGTSYTWIRLGVATIPPLTLMAARTLIAAALLLAWMRWQGIVLPGGWPAWRRFLVQALLNSVLPFTLIAWAERSVDAGLATILNATSPVFACLGTWWLGGRRPLARGQVIGVALGLGGVCLVVGGSAFAELGRQWLPQAAIVVATLCYAGAALYGRNFDDMRPAAPAAGSLVAGAALLLPVALAVDHPWTLRPSGTSLLALAILSTASTALALVIYFRLVRTLGALGTTAQAYLRVPIGVAAAMLVLGEQPPPTAWLGLACVVAGIAAMTRPATARGGADGAPAPHARQ